MTIEEAELRQACRDFIAQCPDGAECQRADHRIARALLSRLDVTIAPATEVCGECRGNGNLNGARNEDGGAQWACSACNGTGRREAAWITEVRKLFAGAPRGIDLDALLERLLENSGIRR